MHFPSFVLPFHRLFSHQDEGNTIDPEKEPNIASGKDLDSDQNKFQNASNTLAQSSESRTGLDTRAEIFDPLTLDSPTPDSQINDFRVFPLISSVFVPFSILLAVPGLTEHWYIRTNARHEIIEVDKEPLYLRIVLSFSMACVIISNICLLVRLLEKAVKKMTFICIVTLSIHDILDTIVIIMFTIKTQKGDGFSLGQAFWMTLCSTIASIATNVTLILDYWQSSEIERHKSGLTERQRAVIIIIVILLCYIAFGAAVNTALLSLSFIDALYFSIVCIETVGFGDIDPRSPGARVFSCIFTIFGILILAVAIGLIREALLEVIQHNLVDRAEQVRKRRILRRWTEAIKWRLERAGLPVWVPIHQVKVDGSWPGVAENGRWRRFWWRLSRKAKHNRCFQRPDVESIEVPMQHATSSMTLNLMALSDPQLQAAAMEAGAHLQELLRLRPGFPNQDHSDYGGPVTMSLTHHRLGHMASILRNFAYAVSVGRAPTETGEGETGSPSAAGIQLRIEGHGEAGDSSPLVEMEREERRMFAVNITCAFGFFLTFWLVGSVIFMATEKWSFWLALYFCFITFSTVGYGDPAPRTPAGRSFFVGWALCEIAAMTILISLLADRYSERYKSMIRAADSSVANNGDHSGVGQHNDTSPPRYASGGVTNSVHKTTEHKQTRDISRSKEFEIQDNQEVASRLDSLKALIVNEAAHEEGLLHTFESELESMLLMIRRSRNQPNQDQ